MDNNLVGVLQANSTLRDRDAICLQSRVWVTARYFRQGKSRARMARRLPNPPLCWTTALLGYPKRWGSPLLISGASSTFEGTACVYVSIIGLPHPKRRAEHLFFLFFFYIFRFSMYAIKTCKTLVARRVAKGLIRIRIPSHPTAAAAFDK